MNNTKSLIQMLNKQQKTKFFPPSEVKKIVKKIERVIHHNEMTAIFVDELIESLLKLPLC